ncbi:non-canonical non-ribosomal peptide synthetase FUB8 [Physcia stellaris]|nr:non-canonical non-ribosomal peptide synthetase FUB8 [Physcia stellaris]
MKVFSIGLGLFGATAIALPTNETGSAVTTSTPPVITVAPPTNETGPLAINNNGPALNGTAPAKNDTGLATNQTDASQITTNLILDADGIVHLGDDGVLRSFAPNLTVLAYLQLNNSQIQSFIDRFGRTDHLTQVYKDANGFDVCEEELSHPTKENLPLNFPDDSVPPTSPNPKDPRSVHHRQLGDINSDISLLFSVDNQRDRCHQIYCRTNRQCYDNHPSCSGCVQYDHDVIGFCW